VKEKNISVKSSKKKNPSKSKPRVAGRRRFKRESLPPRKVITKTE